MARTGWIKLHRKMLDCPELQTAKARSLWLELLLRASGKPTRVIWRARAFDLQAGQLVGSMRELAKAAGISYQEGRTLERVFVLARMLKVNAVANAVGTLITICNFSDYQILSTDANADRNATPTQLQRREREEKNLRLLPESESLTTETPTYNMLDERTSSDVWKDGFAKFYAAYPRKVGSHRAAEKYRQALKAATHEEIMDGLRRAVRCWRRNGTDKGYIPHPATWLHGHRWADELVDIPKPNGGGDPAMNAIQKIMGMNEEVENDDGDPFFQRACDEMRHEIGGPRTYALEIRRTRGNGIGRLC